MQCRMLNSGPFDGFCRPWQALHAAGSLKRARTEQHKKWPTCSRRWWPSQPPYRTAGRAMTSRGALDTVSGQEATPIPIGSAAATCRRSGATRPVCSPAALPTSSCRAAQRLQDAVLRGAMAGVTVRGGLHLVSYLMHLLLRGRRAKGRPAAAGPDVAEMLRDTARWGAFLGSFSGARCQCDADVHADAPTSGMHPASCCMPLSSSCRLRPPCTTPAPRPLCPVGRGDSHAGGAQAHAGLARHGGRRAGGAHHPVHRRPAGAHLAGPLRPHPRPHAACPLRQPAGRAPAQGEWVQMGWLW